MTEVREANQPAIEQSQEEKFKAMASKAEELLNIEEITVVYKGVKQPRTASQLGVELSALRNLKTVIEGRISSLEFDWSVFLEKQRIINGMIEAERLGQGKE